MSTELPEKVRHVLQVMSVSDEAICPQTNDMRNAANWAWRLKFADRKIARRELWYSINDAGRAALKAESGQ
jgi:hypothetical protein